MTAPTNAQRLWMFEQMLVSRYLEESIERIYMEGKTPVFNMANGPIPGEMHLSNGQEPCAVGVCAHLEAGDIVTATHRPHHIAVAKGVDLDEMVAEIFGKKTGLAGGRGGHMHLFDERVNFACSGIIAQGLGPAVGAALSRQLQGKPGVAVAYLGEGAANQGAFHEALNLAALWKLPVVFVIEDNAWGISVAKAASTAIERNTVRAAAYGMPGVFVPGNDPEAIFAAAGEAIARARAGEGPSLLELETSRLAGHFMGDGETYRPAGEKAALQEKDPIPAYRQRLLDLGVADDSVLAGLEEVARGRVDAAVQFARDSAYPAPEEALDFVFV
ncbi:thiamine pyrophosphate-dependent dehydrogenase E1 component subunit alpha [Metapseudomonas furukawaii]|jgi:pyruvate dehydrogenase E1 component alpha subunit|uniref:Acetoin dehydrogenase E1 component alpha-subunit n=1 Tax=Metapseudomonas furukawaii TaxID=1149133 RepID=A0AAD1C063_METFU|nr:MULTISPECIES: thiamine pyrophosphate-dependent dehydrogenase E1 component subunit alpha [Pseudomonas]ELS25092.1 Acetoin dehydrogenase E1 component alpha-subunit [Pseudomonas furukawaii]OWJ91678.1 pyruvate dehydrogenase (acetyl-transferring) E1 component subunit alpha [Pseudomonas sp. A46]WAG76872.1 thiamine pyrophosphate-dependent dehydrogenase E1 component subunit alpha [Pseudomonas furukawaii]BAU74851.1 acetoin dehydrogenase E1 component alpha-subunit [Pseudomonas furukawaii]